MPNKMRQATSAMLSKIMSDTTQDLDDDDELDTTLNQHQNGGGPTNGTATTNGTHSNSNLSSLSTSSSSTTKESPSSQ